MKKLLLATAVTAAMASGAFATTYNVTSSGPAYGGTLGVTMWVGYNQLVIASCGTDNTGLTLGGTASDSGSPGSISSSAVTLSGTVCMDAGGPIIRLTFALTNGNYDRNDPGTTFSGGTIDIDVQTTSGWVPYGTINAGTTNLPFLYGDAGHLGTNTTAGLILRPGTRQLPGDWDGVSATSPGANSAVSAITLFSNTAGMFLIGDFGVN